MPLLLYPLLRIAFLHFQLAGHFGEEKVPDLIIAIPPGKEGKDIASHLAEGERVMNLLPTPANTIEPKTPPPRLMALESSDPRGDVLNRRADLGLRLRRPQPGSHRDN